MRISAISQKVLERLGYFYWINILVILLLNWIAYSETGYLPEYQEDFPIGFLDKYENYHWLNVFLAQTVLFHTWFISLYAHFILSPTYLGILLLLRFFGLYKELNKSAFGFSMYGFILFHLLTYQWFIEKCLYKWTSYSLEIHDFTWWIMD